MAGRMHTTGYAKDVGFHVYYLQGVGPRYHWTCGRHQPPSTAPDIFTGPNTNYYS